MRLKLVVYIIRHKQHYCICVSFKDNLSMSQNPLSSPTVGRQAQDLIRDIQYL